MICYSRFKGKTVFYLDEKNKKAFQSLLETDSSRIISYQQLGRMLQIFNIKVNVDEKKSFLGKNRWRRSRKIKESLGHYCSNPKEKQSLLDDFIGRFLHSDVLHLPRKNTVS